MAEAHAEGELRDQLADLEAQLQQIDEALEATGGADPELETVHEHLLLRVAQCALRSVQTYHVCWGRCARTCWSPSRRAEPRCRQQRPLLQLLITTAMEV